MSFVSDVIKLNVKFDWIFGDSDWLLNLMRGIVFIDIRLEYVHVNRLIYIIWNQDVYGSHHSPDQHSSISFKILLNQVLE